MKIKIEQKNGIGIVSLSGRFDAAETQSFHSTIRDGFDNIMNLVLDLGKLDFIDSTGLGAIITLLKRVSEKEKDIRIANLNPKVRMVFEITRAYKMFDIYDDISAALESFE
jgi:anti-sigma B factor antagonist